MREAIQIKSSEGVDTKALMKGERRLGNASSP